MKILTTTDDLADFCNEARARPFVAVDTEFMREKTYWPILCLVQAAAEGLEAVIDPLAPDLDLRPFLDLLADETVTKVFHAARQDLEIFYRLIGEVPQPLFDTQIAAMACGYGDQVGYEPLMRSLLGAQIDKGSRFTDWARRPLSEKQLAYALSDVTHLRDAYPLIVEKLRAGGREGWVEEEQQTLNDPVLYYVEPSDAWRRLKLRGVRQHELGPIMKLAEWRERAAQERDLPRGRVLKDEALFELARLKPATASDLGRARSVPDGMERSRHGAGMLAAVAEGLKLPRESLPAIERNDRRAPPPADVVDLLRVLLKRQCETFDVAPRLIASTNDLENLARDADAEIPAMKGWRREVFGEPALKLMRGELAMKLERGKLQLVDA